MRKLLMMVLLLLALGFVGAGRPDYPPYGMNCENCARFASQYPSLQAALDDNAGGIVIVDRSYYNLMPIRIPRRTQVVGMGPQGKTVLTFANTVGSSITIGSRDPRLLGPTRGADYVTIENLQISGSCTRNAPVCDASVRGLDLSPTPTEPPTPSGAGIIYLRNLVIRNFHIGVYGNASSSVFIDNCNVSDNWRHNYQLTNGANSWRIRGGLSSAAGVYNPFCRPIDVCDRMGMCCYGIDIEARGGNNDLIEGVRMERNKTAAIRTNSHATHIAHNRFEGNGVAGPQRHGVLIDRDATHTTLMDNYYSSDDTVDRSPGTTLQLDNGLPVQFSMPISAKTLRASVNYVSFSDSPTFDASRGNTHVLMLSGPISRSTLINASHGQQINFIICQGAGAGSPFHWPENVSGGMPVSPQPNTCSTQSFIFIGETVNRAFALSPGVSDLR